MGCLVCGEEYKGAVCPVCKFRNVQIVGDYEDGLKMLQPKIEEHRRNFLGTFSVGIRIMKRVISDTDPISAIPEDLFFGKVVDFYNSEKWLDYDFVSYPIDNVLKINAVIRHDSDIRIESVMIHHISNHGLYKVGVDFIETDGLRFKIKNQDSVIGISNPVDLWKKPNYE